MFSNSKVYVPTKDRGGYIRVQCCSHKGKPLEGYLTVFGVINIYHCSVHALVQESEDNDPHKTTNVDRFLTIHPVIVFKCRSFIKPVSVYDIFALGGKYCSLKANMPSKSHAIERASYKKKYHEFTQRFQIQRGSRFGQQREETHSHTRSSISFEQACKKMIRRTHYIRMKKCQFELLSGDGDDTIVANESDNESNDKNMQQEFVMVVVIFTTDRFVLWSFIDDSRIADHICKHFLNGNAEIPGVCIS